MPQNLSHSEIERIRAVPLWTGQLTSALLPAALPTRNFLVADPAQGRFVVRFGHDIPLHGVMRFNELAAARAAHAASLSPRSCTRSRASW